MGSWREYILSVVSGCLICSIVLQILPDSGRKELLRTICGAVLAMVILQPVSRIRLSDLSGVFSLEKTAAQPYIAMGEQAAEDLKRQYISSGFEAYILEEAEKLGAAGVTPYITLDDACSPVYAEIQGVGDPAIRKKLERVLTEEMGITKENQRWTGIQGNSG